MQIALEQFNLYVGAFRHMHQVEEEQHQLAALSGEEMPRIFMEFTKGLHDRGRYNRYVHNYVATVFVGNEEGASSLRHFHVYSHVAGAPAMPRLSPAVEPLTFALLFIMVILDGKLTSCSLMAAAESLSLKSTLIDLLFIEVLVPSITPFPTTKVLCSCFAENRV